MRSDIASGTSSSPNARPCRRQTPSPERFAGLAEDDREVDAYRERVEAEYEETATEREQDRREFVGRLATGDI
ncbi:hypothetical protein C465_13510 [Halorubrum distributum JCM 9100]|uniref:Uncharacterized protein n=3 Tax=Halorubrum distributum TaxID=29283 RepID=M0ED83_9EURY|nr:hypothetical protein C473_01484 [Halorubrum terrestre JCM 10247]ELZ45761.1 hypothetical protein C465_13510 [Halorubrum distributum JCM 9100]ELZ53550.1 hypothetical protein C466_07605 [Halorubrum distributum JCM 10118]